MIIEKSDLARLFPRPANARKAAIWDGYADAICSAEGAALLARHGITTGRRWHHLAATWGAETGGLTILWESGAYSADGILRVFGEGRHSARVTPAEARKLAGNGPALFERVYGLGNPGKARELGNTQPGDGWRCRGLGLNQITGRWAHERYAAKVGCSLDDLARPINCLAASLIEWSEKGCNKYVDLDDEVPVRKLINAGSLAVSEAKLNGLPHARQYLAAARRIWPDLLVAADSPAGSRPPATFDEGALTCRLGDDGPRVAELQKKLTALGYACGSDDGRFGHYTEGAVAAMQVAHGLPGTGIADARTWEVLATAGPRPGRDVTAEDLRARGSSTVRLAGRIRAAGSWLWKSLFGAGAAEFAGVDVIGKASSAADTVGAAIDKAAGASGTRGAVILIMLGVGVGGWLLARWASEIEAERVAKAAAGGDLTK